MSGFADGESNASVRGKINAILARRFLTMAAMVADTDMTYTTGDPDTVSVGNIIWAEEEGFRYEVVASNATDFDIQTAGGVRVIALPTAAGFYNFKSLNPAADGVTDDYPKLKKLLDRVKIFSNGSLTPRGPSIYFPMAKYFMAQTIDLKSQVHFFGDAQGHFSQQTAELRFAADIHGIVINRENTLSTVSASGIETTPTGAADNSCISGLAIASVGGTDRTKHGIWARTRFKMHCCLVAGFPGNGGHIVAGTDRSDEGFGNANGFYLEACGFQNNKNHGLLVDGIDANASVIHVCDASLNGRMGFYDSSFLGNAYYGCHAATNGLRNKGGNASDQSCVVSFGGNLYAAHWTATEAQLVATTPGTNSAIWVPYGSGGETDNYPLWASGKPEGTYFRAFGYFSDSVSASNFYFNCYNETDAPSALLGRATHVGAMMEGLLTGAKLSSNTAGQTLVGSLQATTGTQAITFADGSGFFSLASSTISGTWRMQEDTGRVVMRHQNVGARTPFYLTKDTDRVPYAFGTERIMMGSTGGQILITFGTAAPTSGAYNRGDMVINTQPSAGGFTGWRCVTSGTPGTWKGYGTIEA